ncbi:hypothetical protein D3C75_1203720 [compost metagenome]
MEGTAAAFNGFHLAVIVLCADVLSQECRVRADCNRSGLVGDINPAARRWLVMLKEIIEFRHRNIDGKQTDIGQLGMADAEQALREFKCELGIQ